MPVNQDALYRALGAFSDQYNSDDYNDSPIYTNDNPPPDDGELTSASNHSYYDDVNNFLGGSDSQGIHYTLSPRSEDQKLALGIAGAASGLGGLAKNPGVLDAVLGDESGSFKLRPSWPPKGNEGWIGNGNLYTKDNSHAFGALQIMEDELGLPYDEKYVVKSGNDPDYFSTLVPKLKEAGRTYSNPYYRAYRPWERANDLGYTRYVYDPRDDNVQLKLSPENLENLQLLRQAKSWISGPQAKYSQHILRPTGIEDMVNGDPLGVDLRFYPGGSLDPRATYRPSDDPSGSGFQDVIDFLRTIK